MPEINKIKAQVRIKAKTKLTAYQCYKSANNNYCGRKISGLNLWNFWTTYWFYKHVPVNVIIIHAVITCMSCTSAVDLENCTWAKIWFLFTMGGGCGTNYLYSANNERNV